MTPVDNMPPPNPPKYDSTMGPGFNGGVPDLELGLKAEERSCPSHRCCPGSQAPLSPRLPVAKALDVIYTYTPRWPFTGDVKETLGPLCPSREVRCSPDGTISSPLFQTDSRKQ